MMTFMLIERHLFALKAMVSFQWKNPRSDILSKNPDFLFEEF